MSSVFSAWYPSSTPLETLGGGLDSGGGGVVEPADENFRDVGEDVVKPKVKE